ncbi:hypothetical protein AAG906_041083 [Vitis piasezkii]
MSGSNMEETSEQTRGRKIKPTARGRGRKDKSRDAIANMEARLAKMELAMADMRVGVDLIEQGMEKGLEDLKEQIQDLHEGVLGSQVQPVSHKEFMSFQDKVMSMFASIESRMEALVREIKRQFYPEDVAYLARKNMKRLKHTSSIYEYVKEFSMFMLEYPTCPRRSYCSTSWTTCKIGTSKS